MDLTTLKEFEREVAEDISGFQVRFKDKSLWQKLLGFLIYPFNRDYMSSYTTTLHPLVYFPSQAFYETKPKSFTILSHEFVHLVDAQNHPFWMKLSYLLPQLLGVFPLAAFGILAGTKAWILGLVLFGYIFGCLLARLSKPLFWCVLLGSLIATGVLAVLLTGWVSAALFLGLAFFAPWPSPWRVKWELRGYAMNLATMQWMHGAVPEILTQSVLRQFVTPKYYYMSWSEDDTYKKLTEIIRKAENGTLEKEHPYSTVFNFLKSHDLLKK